MFLIKHYASEERPIPWSICPSICPYVCLYVCHCTHPSIYLSFRVFLRLSLHIHIFQSFCILSVRRSVYPSVCLFARMSVYMSVLLCVRRLFVYSPFCLSFRSTICLSSNRSVCLSRCPSGNNWFPN